MCYSPSQISKHFNLGMQYHINIHNHTFVLRLFRITVPIDQNIDNIPILSRGHVINTKDYLVNDKNTFSGSRYVS